MAELLTGPAGRAWPLPLRTETIAQQAAIGCYLVEAPRAHPLWSQYTLAAAHLRPIAGALEPELFHPAATHQVWLFAIRSDDHREPDDGQSFPPRLLSPQNYTGQWRAPSDADALGDIRRAALDIVNGLLSPDTDFRLQWRQRFPFLPPEPGMVREAAHG